MPITTAILVVSREISIYLLHMHSIMYLKMLHLMTIITDSEIMVTGAHTEMNMKDHTNMHSPDMLDPIMRMSLLYPLKTDSQNWETIKGG